MMNQLRTATETNNKPGRRARYLRAFRRDEDGGIIVLTLLLLIVMLVMGGMAVDFMRYEAQRVKLQSVSDRAVLAAAELDQALDSKEVVTDYFKSEGLEDTIIGEPVVSNESGTRSVRVDSEIDVNTIYLRLIGIDQLDAPAESAAIEGVGNVEISLVLDISGSMAGAKLRSLKSAASSFVTEMLDPEYEDQISLSLIAYSQHVSLGQELYGALNTTPDTMLADGTRVDSRTYDLAPLTEHVDYTTNTARCIDFNQGEYATTTFDVGRTYDQVETFEYFQNRSQSTFSKPVCPHEDYEGIVALTQDPTILTTAINRYRATSYTSIHLGMKWGVSLLDPSMRPVIASMPSMDPAFAGSRPLAYEANAAGVTSVKYVVLMTDGANVAGRRIRPEYYDDFFWREVLNSNPYLYWRNNIRDHPRGSRPGVWGIGQAGLSRTVKNNLLQSTCTAAKDAGIIVYTISMEAVNDGVNQMRNCASEPSDSYFFDTTDDAIDDIFSSIADQIKKLRLSL